jgi:hypothetical protein
MDETLKVSDEITVPELMKLLRAMRACTQRNVILPFTSPQDAWKRIPYWALEWWLMKCRSEQREVVFRAVHAVQRTLEEHRAQANITTRYDVERLQRHVVLCFYPNWADPIKDGHMRDYYMDKFHEINGRATRRAERKKVAERQKQAKNAEFTTAWRTLTWSHRRILANSLNVSDTVECRVLMFGAACEKTRIRKARGYKRWLHEAIAVAKLSQLAATR